MKKKILVEVEIEIDDDRPECCGKECNSLLQGKVCDLFIITNGYSGLDTIVNGAGFWPLRCEQCLAAKEAKP
jgi:hypothetical protein